MSSQGWTANATTQFFMFTAKGIGSCFDGGSSTCSDGQYCADHRWIGGGPSATLDANMPYGSPYCDVGQQGLVTGDPKSASSRRQIGLPATAREVLRRRRIQQKEERLLAGPDWQESGDVVTTALGTVFEPRHYNRS